MQLFVEKLHSDAIIPSYHYPSDSGMDLYSVKRVAIYPMSWELVPTGIAIALPPSTEGQVRPKSGLSLKYGISVLNTPGTIDENYRGEIKVIVQNFSHETFLVEIGMKIAQLVIVPVLHPQIIEVDSLEYSDRQDKGFGSTGLYL